MRLAVDHRKAFKKKSRYRSFCFSVGCQQCNGSLTVEASIVLPIFLSVIMALMSFFEVIHIQTRIHQGMKDLVTRAAGYYYLFEERFFREISVHFYLHSGSVSVYGAEIKHHRKMAIR